MLTIRIIKSVIYDKQNRERNLYTVSESTFLSNSPRFPKERCFLEGARTADVCPAGKSNLCMKMSEEHW